MRRWWEDLTNDLLVLTKFAYSFAEQASLMLAPAQGKSRNSTEIQVSNELFQGGFCKVSTGIVFLDLM